MTPEEYLRRVQATAAHASNYLPSEQLAEVDSLIEHGEPAEGLCSLAWAIVGAQIRVPKNIVDAIYEYTAGVVDEDFLPAELRDYVQLGDDHA